MKQPRHETGTCGYEVMKKVNGIYQSVPLKDSRGRCPGDPLCRYTLLGRLDHRMSMQPAMRRAKKMLVAQGVDKDVLDWEFLYNFVCAVTNVETRAPVEDYKWPLKNIPGLDDKDEEEDYFE